MRGLRPAGTPQIVKIGLIQDTTFLSWSSPRLLDTRLIQIIPSAHLRCVVEHHHEIEQIQIVSDGCREKFGACG